MGVSQSVRFFGPVSMTIGAIVGIAGSFGDWLSSGRVGRSSYDILGLVDRLGFTPDGLIGSLVRAWPLMPLMLVGAVVAAWWRQRLIAIAFGVVGGLYAGALGAVVAVSVPDRRSISVDSAPWVTALGGGLVVLGSLALCFVRVPSADADSR